MHVGYVVKRYPRFSETFIVNEILAHEAAGHRVTIFALGAGLDERFQESIAHVQGSVRYLVDSPTRAADVWSALVTLRESFPETPIDLWLEEQPRYVRSAVRLATEVEQLGIDHLHAHFATSATTIARLASLATGVPYSFTAHAKDIFHESVSHEDLEKKIADAEHVVTVSDYNLAFLSSQFERHSHRIRRIYNGLPLDNFKFSPPVNRRPQILAVGRLVEKKGFTYLVEACALLRDRGVAFSCDIVGAGDQEAQLREVIASNRLGRDVHLLGPVPLCEVKRMIEDAAVFAAPCVVGADGNRDGLPTVLLEAMALGTPCVSTDVTGIPEILHDGTTGLMVGQHDAEGLADALQSILVQPALGSRLAHAARALIEEQFDVQKNAAALRVLFEDASVPAERVLACA